MVANNIKVLAIPGHTSHVLQPLDSTPFANLKMVWNQNLSQYFATNVGVPCQSNISGSPSGHHGTKQ